MQTNRTNAIAAAQIALFVAQQDARAPSPHRIRVEAWLAQGYRRELANLGGLPA